MLNDICGISFKVIVHAFKYIFALFEQLYKKISLRWRASKSQIRISEVLLIA